MFAGLVFADSVKLKSSEKGQTELSAVFGITHSGVKGKALFQGRKAFSFYLLSQQ